MRRRTCHADADEVSAPEPASKDPKPRLPHESLGGGVIVVKPRRFGDERGYFAETFHLHKWASIGINVPFVQDNESLSTNVGTIRALHYQVPPFDQAKLVRCLKGSIVDVAVDIRRNSPTFKQVFRAELSGDGGEQMFVPSGFAHGFATLEPDTIVAYKVSSVYDPQSERGIRFDDPDLRINWQTDLATATVNARDRDHPLLKGQPDLF